jgi:cellulose biosynthesis protein BcsQ
LVKLLNKAEAVALRSDDIMIDGWKRMHSEVADGVRDRFSGILSTAIPYLSAVEQIGIWREPVPAFTPKSRAAHSFQALWNEVELELLK